MIDRRFKQHKVFRANGGVNERTQERVRTKVIIELVPRIKENDGLSGIDLSERMFAEYVL